MKTWQLLTVLTLVSSSTARADVPTPPAPADPLVRIEAESTRCSLLPEVLRWWAEPLRPLTTVRDGVGFVARDDGLIAAPASLVKGADRITVALSDGRRLSGDVVSIHTATRTALLRIATSGLEAATLKAPRSLSFGADLRLGKHALTYVGGAQETVMGLASSEGTVKAGTPLMDRSGAIVGVDAKLLTIPIPAPMTGVIHLVHAPAVASLKRAIEAIPRAPRLEIDDLFQPSWKLLGWPLRLEGEEPGCEPVPLD